MYSDDGLRVRLAPLLATSAGNGGLLSAARALQPWCPAAACLAGRDAWADAWARARRPRCARCAELSADLAHMGKLLDAAKSEVYIFRKPRTFPTEQYR